MKPTHLDGNGCRYNGSGANLENLVDAPVFNQYSATRGATEELVLGQVTEELVTAGVHPDPANRIARAGLPPGVDGESIIAQTRMILEDLGPEFGNQFLNSEEFRWLVDAGRGVDSWRLYQGADDHGSESRSREEVIVIVHHQKAGKLTHFDELQRQVRLQEEGWNHIMAHDGGIEGLKQRIQDNRNDWANISSQGRAYVDSLPNPGRDPTTGERLAWLHGPDMRTGGRPMDIVGRGLLRENSIIGGQANQLAEAILDLPSTTIAIRTRMQIV